MDSASKWMREAIALSRKGMQENLGGPFGCIVVKGDEIIGRGNNRVTANNDPTAHAEIVAIREACQALGSFQLTDCDIYTTCEPCPMCMGAIYWARPRKVYFANTRHDAAAIGFDDSMIYEELALTMEERSIPLIGIGRHEALQVFEEWQQKTDKISY